MYLGILAKCHDLAAVPLTTEVDVTTLPTPDNESTRRYHWQDSSGPSSGPSIEGYSTASNPPHWHSLAFYLVYFSVV